MLISDITVEVRDDTFNRIGQILPKDLVGFKAVLRFNNVGSWEITLPAGHEVGEILRLPGSGIIVTGPSGVILSGPTMSATNSKTRENPNGEWLITGVDDSVILGERLAYPDPTSADVTAQATPYDVRHTIASTAMIGYVSDNIGPTGALQRKISNLSVVADPALGSYVYPAARFDILGELLSGIASIDGLGFDVKQTDGILEFQVYQPEDRSGYIRMDVANNTLSSTQYAYGSHSLSRAIVAGQGEGSNRQFVEVTSTESLSAETLWGRRIETFIDQRNTSDADELEQAGQEKLADGGATLTSVDVTPSSDLTMAYGQDWGLGDKVTVVVDEQEVQAIVTTVSMSIESDGIRVGATVGEPTGVDYESKMAKRSTNTAQRVNALERKEVPAISWTTDHETYQFKLDEHVTLQIGQEHVIRVKNASTSVAIPDRSVVMFAGATGDTVKAAPAVADGTYNPNYLIGVTTEVIPADGFGFVTQFGFINNVDTSAWAAGTILYANPAVAGGFTSTQPEAPSWTGAVAAVTRSHATTGRMLVRAIPVEAPGSSLEISDVAPSGATHEDIWWDSDDGSLYVRFIDADGTAQWVQASIGGDNADPSQITTIQSRLTSAENEIFSLDARADTLESEVDTLQSQMNTVLGQSGYYVRQVFSDIDTTSRTASTSWGLMWTAPIHNGFLAGSKVKIHIELPLRNESTSWGGAYIEPQVTFNGGTNWYSMGSSGYDGNVMQLSSSSIATYTRMLFLDPQLHGISGSYNFGVRIYMKSYDGSVRWNYDHDLNAVSGTVSNIGNAQNLNQHYCRIHIEELAVIA